MVSFITVFFISHTHTHTHTHTESFTQELYVQEDKVEKKHDCFLKKFFLMYS